MEANTATNSVAYPKQSVDDVRVLMRFFIITIMKVLYHIVDIMF